MDLHIAGSLLFFLVLASMTGSVWASAFAVVVFALHPQHVESVAWIAEKANKLTACTNAAFLDTLTIAYASAGRFDEAARKMRRKSGDTLGFLLSDALIMKRLLNNF